jgi:hypothetical protein
VTIGKNLNQPRACGLELSRPDAAVLICIHVGSELLIAIKTVGGNTGSSPVDFIKNLNLLQVLRILNSKLVTAAIISTDHS